MVSTRPAGRERSDAAHAREPEAEPRAARCCPKGPERSGGVADPRCEQACEHTPSVELMGLEPTTPCLQSRCSSQLSYSPSKGASVYAVDFCCRRSDAGGT